MVAESDVAGAVASEVARRHDITPQHLFARRKAARAGCLVLPAEASPMFVPVVTSKEELGAEAVATNHAGSIAIEIAGMVVRVEPSVDLGCGVMCYEP